MASDGFGPHDATSGLGPIGANEAQRRAGGAARLIHLGSPGMPLRNVVAQVPSPFVDDMVGYSD